MLSHRLSRLGKICTGTSSGGREELLQLEGRLERVVHFWTLVIRHFIKNRCLIRASALAFTSLLSLIPLLVLAVSITSSLLKSEGEDQIYHAIDKMVSGIVPPASMTVTNGELIAVAQHREAGGTNSLAPAGTVELTVSNNLVTATPATNAASLVVSTNVPVDSRVITAQKEAARSIHDYIQNAQSGKLGITGMVLFIFTAIGMLRGVENTFNDIWGVTVERQWWHQLSGYFTIVALGPVALIAAVSLAGGPYLHLTDHLVARIPFLGRILLEIGPLVVLWLIFAMFYMLIPNTQVKFSAAFFGGLIAGTLWHLNNIFAFLYISRVVTNSEIYGKLGLVPVFMLGLYFSWAILLFGAQVAYACQNRAAYLQDRIAENVNQRGREFVALRIMTLLGQRFQNGLPPAQVIELSAELSIPSRLTHRVLQTLTDAHLVTQAACEGAAYVPARPLDTITAHHILRALRAGAGKELLPDDTSELAGIYGDFARIEAAERAAAEKISVLTLVRHLPAPLTLLPAQSDEPIPAVSAFGGPEKPKSGKVAPATSPVSGGPMAEAENGPEYLNVEKSFSNVEKDSPEKISTKDPIKTSSAPANREVVQPEETEFPL
ncbi:MAG TPA: YhjD/YihY/BrkB family envelope integrity protein [Candidatus Acidoferrum sp.]|nr:YhjD/YihY/BrkB family envelope integrity protein [Candidatus Acidoferrum sp.]